MTLQWNQFSLLTSKSKKMNINVAKFQIFNSLIVCIHWVCMRVWGDCVCIESVNNEKCWNLMNKNWEEQCWKCSTFSPTHTQFGFLFNCKHAIDPVLYALNTLPYAYFRHCNESFNLLILLDVFLLFHLVSSSSSSSSCSSFNLSFFPCLVFCFLLILPITGSERARAIAGERGRES